MTTQSGDKTTSEGVASPGGERINVALIPKVSDSLRRLQERTSMSKTDITNRSITLYDFIDAQLQAGYEVLIRDNRTGEIRIVQILLGLVPPIAASMRTARSVSAHTAAGQIISVVPVHAASQPAAVASALAAMSETLRRPVPSPTH